MLWKFSLGDDKHYRQHTNLPSRFSFQLFLAPRKLFTWGHKKRREKDPGQKLERDDRKWVEGKWRKKIFWKWKIVPNSLPVVTRATFYLSLKAYPVFPIYYRTCGLRRRRRQWERNFHDIKRKLNEFNVLICSIIQGMLSYFILSHLQPKGHKLPLLQLFILFSTLRQICVMNI